MSNTSGRAMRSSVCRSATARAGVSSMAASRAVRQCNTVPASTPARARAIETVNTAVRRSRIGTVRITTASPPGSPVPDRVCGGSATIAAQPVPGTPHRLQRGDPERAVDLVPQRADVHVDDVGAGLGGEVPAVFQQGVAGKYRVG